MTKHVALGIGIFGVCLSLLAGFAYAADGEPRDSGFVLAFVPRVHILNLDEEITWEDTVSTGVVGEQTLEMDETEFDVNESLGVYFNLSYITSGYVFFGLEFGHQVFLGTVEGDLKSTTGDGTLLNNSLGEDGAESTHEYNIKSTQLGGFAGLYLHKAPIRPYIQAGAGAAFEELSFMDEEYKSEGMPLYAFGSAGIDFFASEHLCVGGGARLDQFLGESFSKDYTEDGNDHEFTTDVSRLPLSAFFKIGYMF